MSRLYLTESGHVVATLCEELTTYRRVRKVVRLPATASQGIVYILARAYPASGLPLRLAVNGAEVTPVEPCCAGRYVWHAAFVPSSLLGAGANTFELWTDSTKMDAWSLGVEAGHADPGSFVSTDSGASWRNEKMGYLNVVRGEYVVRVRLAEGEDPQPPPVVWEDPGSPRLAWLRKIMPPATLEPGPLLRRVRALTRWLAGSWEYTNTARATQYAPWDAETILAWGIAQAGHDGRRPIVMCVHYGVAFVTCCQAAGITARCVVGTFDINSPLGHFLAEVWFKELGKWVLVDPQLDAVFRRGASLLSAGEVQQARSDLHQLVEWGPGIEAQRRTYLGNLDDVYLRGDWLNHRSVWWRSDFLSHPELTPPGHGATAYCETGLVWERRELDRGLGMFPHFAGPSYFDAPPTHRDDAQS